MNQAEENIAASQEENTEAEGGVTYNELAEMCDRRAGTYYLLARIYRTEADAELLATMRKMHFPVGTGNDKVDRGYLQIAKFLAGTWENSVSELATDYARTFIGGGIDGFSAAYPYESVYTSEKRLIMQDARDEVLAIYRSLGLDKSSQWTDGEDHIALELELMMTLCQRASKDLVAGDAAGARKCLETQKNFLDDHLNSWVPMFTADVRRFARLGLYHGVADLTEGFLEVESQLLEDILSGSTDE